MRAYSTNRNKPDPTNSVFIGAASTTSEPQSASVHLLNSPTKPGQHRGSVRGKQMPPTLRDQMADFLVDVEGLPVVVRLLVKELLAEMQSGFVSKGADIHTLLSSTLASMADRIRVSSLRNSDLSKQSSVRGESISSGLASDTWPHGELLQGRVDRIIGMAAEFGADRSATSAVTPAVSSGLFKGVETIEPPPAR